MKRTKVRPFAQVRLTQNDSTSIPKPLHNKSVLPRRGGIQKSEAPGGRLHPAGRIDVVLDEHGNAVQRPELTFAGACAVAFLSYIQSVRIELDDGVKLGVDVCDPCEIVFGQLLIG